MTNYSNYYYDFETKKIMTLDELKEDFSLLRLSDDFKEFSFDEYMETAIEWQDVIELDKYDLETLKSEKCYFCKDSQEIIPVSVLREHFNRYDYMKNDYETFEEWLSAQCAPWESLVEMN